MFFTLNVFPNPKLNPKRHKSFALSFPEGHLFWYSNIRIFLLEKSLKNHLVLYRLCMWASHSKIFLDKISWLVCVPHTSTWAPRTITCTQHASLSSSQVKQKTQHFLIFPKKMSHASSLSTLRFWHKRSKIIKFKAQTTFVWSFVSLTHLNFVEDPKFHFL